MADCATDAGYQQHRSRRQIPCQACCAAHAATEAFRRAQAKQVESLLYAQARAGREPAEALSTEERARLVADLVGRGWPDARIAAHTRMTEYTTARIRDRLELPANQAGRRSVA